MKKLVLSLLSVSLLTPLVYASEISKDDSLVSIVKQAVQSAGVRVSELVNAHKDTVKDKAASLVVLANVNKNRLVTKAQEYKSSLAAVATTYKNNLSAQAEMLKQTAIKNRVKSGVTLLAAITIYKTLRYVGPCSFSKKDGLIKRGIKVTLSAGLTAAASLYAFNKMTTLCI